MPGSLSLQRPHDQPRRLLDGGSDHHVGGQDGGGPRGPGASSCNLGLKELAAETPEQYVALAVQLAGDLPRLQELRSTLRERMPRSPLMDAGRFARNMEQAYREMWRRWCQSPGAELK